MKKEIQIPTSCPSCASALIRIKDQLFCKNDLCFGVQIKKIVHFAKTMKIKGLGEKTIEKLGFESMLDIYIITQDELKQLLGEKISSKLYIEIEKSKESSIDLLLSAFSIPLIGGTAAKKVIAENLIDIDKDACVDLGEKAKNNLLNWLRDNKDLWQQIPISTKPTKISPLMESVCISGKLTDYSSKSKAEELINDLGFSITKNITKSTKYLINEDKKESSKIKKARKYNIEILTIEELKGK